MSRRKKTGLYLAGMCLMMAVTAVICWYLFHKKEETGLVFDDNASVGVLPGIDIDERRKQLQEELDDSLIAFSINTSAAGQYYRR